MGVLLECDVLVDQPYVNDPHLHFGSLGHHSLILSRPVKSKQILVKGISWNIKLGCRQRSHLLLDIFRCDTTDRPSMMDPGVPVASEECFRSLSSMVLHINTVLNFLINNYSKWMVDQEGGE